MRTLALLAALVLTPVVFAQGPFQTNTQTITVRFVAQDGSQLDGGKKNILVLPGQHPLIYGWVPGVYPALPPIGTNIGTVVLGVGTAVPRLPFGSLNQPWPVVTQVQFAVIVAGH